MSSSLQALCSCLESLWSSLKEEDFKVQLMIFSFIKGSNFSFSVQRRSNLGIPQVILMLNVSLGGVGPLKNEPLAG